jgi:hypothetical protein
MARVPAAQLGLALTTLASMGIRFMMMFTVQRGSFTGDLTVDPTHLRDLLRAAPSSEDESE